MIRMQCVLRFSVSSGVRTRLLQEASQCRKNIINNNLDEDNDNHADDEDKCNRESSDV